MPTREDGPAAEARSRRWRRDDRSPAPTANDPPASTSVSGRRTVAAIVAVVLTLWLGLDLTFRSWKARYLARAEFGAHEVAPVIDPLAALLPPDVDPYEWRVAVTDTHAMLLALTGSGLLDESQMATLRREIAAEVAEARPETARQTLALLWDDLEKNAGPVIAPDRTPPPAGSRHAARNPRPARPRILGPGLKVR